MSLFLSFRSDPGPREPKPGILNWRELKAKRMHSLSKKPANPENTGEQRSSSPPKFTTLDPYHKPHPDEEDPDREDPNVYDIEVVNRYPHVSGTQGTAQTSVGQTNRTSLETGPPPDVPPKVDDQIETEGGSETLSSPVQAPKGPRPMPDTEKNASYKENLSPKERYMEEQRRIREEGRKQLEANGIFRSATGTVSRQGATSKKKVAGENRSPHQSGQTYGVQKYSSLIPPLNDESNPTNEARQGITSVDVKRLNMMKSGLGQLIATPATVPDNTNQIDDESSTNPAKSQPPNEDSTREDDEPNEITHANSNQASSKAQKQPIQSFRPSSTPPGLVDNQNGANNDATRNSKASFLPDAESFLSEIFVAFSEAAKESIVKPGNTDKDLNTIRDGKEEMAKFATKHEKKVGEMAARLRATLLAEASKESQKTVKELEESVKRTQRVVEDLEKSHAAKIEHLNAEHAAKIKQLNLELQNNEKSLTEAHFSDTVKIHKSYGEDLAQLKVEIAKLSDQKLAADKHHEDEIEEMQKSYEVHLKTQLQFLHNSYADQMAQLMEEIKELKDQIIAAETKSDEEKEELRKICDADKSEQLQQQQTHYDSRILKLKNNIVELMGQKDNMEQDHGNELVRLNKERATMLEQHQSHVKILHQQYGNQRTAAIKDLQNQHAEYTGQLESEVLRLKAETQTMQTKHNSEIEALQTRHKNEIEGLMEGYQRQINAELQKRDNEHSLWKRQLESDHLQQIRRLDNDISRLESENQNLESTHQGRHGTLKGEHKREMRELKQGFEIERQEREHALALMVENHSAELAAERSQLQQEMATVQSNLETEIRRLNAVISTTRAAFEVEKEKALKAVKRDNEAYKKALVKKEHGKAITDDKIAREFQDLADEIEDFARVEWDRKKENEWPCPPSTFRASRHEKKLKKNILQSRMWELLYERIFCTPFHVLGTSGKMLEDQWIDIFPQDWKNTERPGWPKPSERAERWRCEEVKKCRESLENATPPLKGNYERVLIDLAKDLLGVLDSVSFVDNNVLKGTKDLAKRAAALWLELETQRFRILVMMPNHMEALAQGGNGQKAHNDIIVQPQVRRIGNSAGEELEREEVVSGCKGTYTNLQSG